MVVRQGVALRRAARGRRPRHDRPARRRVRGRGRPHRRSRRAALVARARRRSSGASGAWARPPSTSPARCARIELAAIGRRVAEQEWDLIELLAPDAWTAAAAAPLPTPLARRAGLYGRPTARELLDAVRELPHRRRHARDDRPHCRSTPGSRPTCSASSSASSRNRPPTTTATTGTRSPLAVRDKLAVANPKHLDPVP